MRLRLLQLKNWRKRQRIKQHPAVYLQRHFVILMHLIFIFLQTTEQKAPHIGLGCSLHRQWGYQSLTQTETQVTAPIACTFLQGVASDIGNAGQNPAVAIGIGFNGTQTIYLRADASTSRSVGSHYIIVGKAL